MKSLRKISLFFGFLYLFSFNSDAQINQFQKLDSLWGISIGYQNNFVNTTGNVSGNYSESDAFRAGVSYLYFFEKAKSLDLNLTLDNKEFDQIHEDSRKEDEVTTSFISIIPMFNFNLFKSDFNFKVGGRISIEIVSSIFKYEPVKFGLVSGFGHTFDLGEEYFNYTLRPEILFDYGLSELDRDNNFEVNSLIFQVTVFYE